MFATLILSIVIIGFFILVFSFKYGKSKPHKCMGDAGCSSCNNNDKDPK